MKQYRHVRYFIIALLLIVTTHGAAQAPAGRSWKWAYPVPQGNPAFGMAFRDSIHGWGVGARGEMFVTNDRGEHWSAAAEPFTRAEELYDIVWLGNETYLAAGRTPHFLRSTDGGTSWSPQSLPGEPDGIHDLALIPGGGISAATSGGSIYISTDNGATWTKRRSAAAENTHGVPQRALHHRWNSAQKGFIVGQALASKTTDGGDTWKDFLTAVTFHPDTALHTFNELYSTGGDSLYVFGDFLSVRSTDGGATWFDSTHIATEPLYRYRSIALSPATWLAFANGEGADLWVTKDAGATWDYRGSFNPGGFTAVCRIGVNRIVAATSSGEMVYSDDLFLTHSTAVPGNGALAEVNGTVSVDPAMLVRRGEKTLYMQSTETPSVWMQSDDEGASWSFPSASPAMVVTCGAFNDSMRGAVGGHKSVRYTTNGGEEWKSAAVPENLDFTGMAAPKENAYFAAARSTIAGSADGALLRSTDGGATWSPAGGGAPSAGIRYTDVLFTSPSNGIALGLGAGTNEFAVFRTTDGGTQWSKVAAAGVPATASKLQHFGKGVLILPVDNANGKGIFRSDDGGESWSAILPGISPRIVFMDEKRAVAAGTGRDIAFTTDGGTTWSEHVNPFGGLFPGMSEQFLNVQSVRDGWLFSCPYRGVIKVTEPSLLSVRYSAGRSDGRSAALSVHPNPFNPSTTVRYTVERAGEVTVAVYDMLGRRIAVAAEGAHDAGTYTVQWHAGGRASGVYFVRCTTAGSTVTRRLLLMR